MKKLILSLAASAIYASAQFSTGVYLDYDTDLNTAWATTTIQYSPGQNCTMCQTAWHTYLVGAQITGDAYNTCTNQFGQSASTSANATCTTAVSLPTDSDGGPSGAFAINAEYELDCSQIGNVMNVAWYRVGTLGVAKDSYLTTYCVETGSTLAAGGYNSGAACPSMCGGQIGTYLNTPGKVTSCQQIMNQYFAIYQAVKDYNCTGIEWGWFPTAAACYTHIIPY